MTIEWGIGVAIALSVVVEVAPIKINPWKSLARAVGRAVNGEIIKEIAEVKTTLKTHIEAEEEREAKDCRRRLLRFNDEILEHKKHSREHFRDAMRDIDRYVKYCDDHPDFKNSEAVATIDNIRRIYSAAMEKNDFL